MIHEPVAIIGAACRLPGGCSSLEDLWTLLSAGKIASNEPPLTRFNLGGHYDGSRKPRTMRSPGGMFLDHIDPSDIDAHFFGLSRQEAVSMDPQQRQLLEVVYEALENAGIPLQSIDGKEFGCFVASFAGDYADIQARDPEDRAPSTTLGNGRAMLSNRISHFLNLKGASMTVDTACSGSLQSLEIACQYLMSGDISGAIVAAANLYLSPEHNEDFTAMKGAHSLSGKCHAFDAKADGYIKAEAVNVVILKRLSDAIRDGDCVRLIVKGWASTSDGWTPGIASPKASSQSLAIRKAYARAGIEDLSQTNYLECHGTGTQAGDPIEYAIADAFAPFLTRERPLRIGSIKSNIGHSEPASGLSGLLKCMLAMQNGIIPGNPTFETPNPAIDFLSHKIYCSKLSMPWPATPIRRASINSFGYGGSNTHLILDYPVQSLCNFETSRDDANDVDFFVEPPKSPRPRLLVISANDELSLLGNEKMLKRHLANPAVNISLDDLVYTLAARRSHHFHRAVCITDSPAIHRAQFIYGKKMVENMKVAFVFTGQGAQWPSMGHSLCRAFPELRALLDELDSYLSALPCAPKWSIYTELTEERSSDQMRRPEFSQTLVTALQICLIFLLRDWGIQPSAVIGHSSGEIGAAYASGHITMQDAIRLAYLRGLAVSQAQAQTVGEVRSGMLAIGEGANQVKSRLAILSNIWVACENSPDSATVSGHSTSLDSLEKELQQLQIFARRLHVDAAYHCPLMQTAAELYHELVVNHVSLESHCDTSPMSRMYSTVTGRIVQGKLPLDYWKKNMLAPVLFHDGIQAMLDSPESSTFFIELGPSPALAGPLKQIFKANKASVSPNYAPTLSRGQTTVHTLFTAAAKLFIGGANLSFLKINDQCSPSAKPKFIVDLPNYYWNHSTKYWYESQSSKDWRMRKFPIHDLLGSKILGTPWKSPVWKKTINLDDIPWLKDHKLGTDIVFPAAGYISMACEAIGQVVLSEGEHLPDSSAAFAYFLRDVRFEKALVLKSQSQMNNLSTTLESFTGSSTGTYLRFSVFSLIDDQWSRHCTGMVMLRLLPELEISVAPSPLEHSVPAELWYKALANLGYTFGAAFKKQLAVDVRAGQSTSRSELDLSPPSSNYDQSKYVMHPACIDGCLQSAAPCLWNGFRTSVQSLLVPLAIDELELIDYPGYPVARGIAEAISSYSGVGDSSNPKNYHAGVLVRDAGDGRRVLELKGLRFGSLDLEQHRSGTSYLRPVFLPDINYLRREQNFIHALQNTLDSALFAPTDQTHREMNLALIGLVSHKRPQLRALEIWLDKSTASSMLINYYNMAELPINCKELHIVAPSANQILQAEQDFGSTGIIKTELITSFCTNLSRFHESFDLIIINGMDNSIEAGALREHLGAMLREQSILIQTAAYLGKHSHSSPSQDNQIYPGVETVFLMKPSTSSTVDVTASVIYRKISEIGPTSSLTAEVFYVIEANEGIYVEIAQHLSTAGLSLTPLTSSADAVRLPKSSILLLIDDPSLSKPLHTKDGVTWTSMKEVFSLSKAHIIWVTFGSQMQVYQPDGGLVHGFTRTLRAELPRLQLTTLDLNPSLSQGSLEALTSLIKGLNVAEDDREYVERNGILYVERIYCDLEAEHEERLLESGAGILEQSFHGSDSCIRLHCRQIGALDSLQWMEINQNEIPILEDHMVEVELYAAGINFKDVACAMGIVPENEKLLGLEGAGIIRRYGAQVTNFKEGDRVLVFKRGALANRIRVTVDGVHHIPPSMSFEEASTLACVFSVCIYGLFRLAKLEKGQTVLIHSAAGGVGLAAIQLCQYMGNDIFVTVGTEEKKYLLMETYRIPESRIFSSRTTEFASKILDATAGRGVDIILNSLTGDMLRQSWACVAAGGTMIEIGKKDILDHSDLPMAPFDRNVSFRSIDMSHWSISNSVHQAILSQLFELVHAGHIRPIQPCTIFRYNEVGAAFRHMRNGNHIGKVILSNEASKDLQLPVHRARKMLELRADSAYLLVGGLQGICGSLALYMATLGARHLLVMSRRGAGDATSRRILSDLQALGCQCIVMQADVTVKSEVHKAFNSINLPVRGIVHGAMVLRDKIFDSMSFLELQDVLGPKWMGTWNLHNVALSSNAPLDFFTMLSSLSGVIGQKSQANYAAGNTFQDSFARYREGLNLPACAIDLGVIEDVGYISQRADLAARLDKTTWITGIDEAALHRVFRLSISVQMARDNFGTTTIIRPSGPSMLRSVQLIAGLITPQKPSATLLVDPRFRTLAYNSVSTGLQNLDTASVRDSTTDAETIRSLGLLLASGAGMHTALTILTPLLNAQISKTIGLSTNEFLDPARSFSNYGLDSLASVEIRNWITLALGAELTTLEINGTKNILDLGELIITKMMHAGQGQSTSD